MHTERSRQRPLGSLLKRINTLGPEFVRVFQPLQFQLPMFMQPLSRVPGLQGRTQDTP